MSKSKANIFVPSDIFIGIASPNGRAPIHTISALKDCGAYLGSNIYFVISQGSSINKNRNHVKEYLLQTIPPDEVAKYTHILTFWLDDDIFLDYSSVPQVVKFIVKAQQDAIKGKLIAYTANYNRLTGDSSIMKERTYYASPNYTKEEIGRMTGHETVVGMSGFGFLATPIPLDYIFHADRIGEDVYFWMENPDIKLKLWTGINLAHQKIALF